MGLPSSADRVNMFIFSRNIESHGGAGSALVTPLAYLVVWVYYAVSCGIYDNTQEVSFPLLLCRRTVM